MLGDIVEMTIVKPLGNQLAVSRSHVPTIVFMRTAKRKGEEVLLHPALFNHLDPLKKRVDTRICLLLQWSSSPK